MWCSFEPKSSIKKFKNGCFFKNQLEYHPLPHQQLYKYQSAIPFLKILFPSLVQDDLSPTGSNNHDVQRRIYELEQYYLDVLNGMRPFEVMRLACICHCLQLGMYLKEAFYLGATSIEKISASGRNFLDPLPPSSKKGPTDENVGISYLIVIIKFSFFVISPPPPYFIRKPNLIDFYN